MKLHTDVGNVNALKILISAAQNNQKLDVITTKPTGKDAAVDKRLPILEVSGTSIFSSNAAASLMFSMSGQCSADQALVDQWSEWESSQWQPVAQAYLTALYGSGKPNSGTLKTFMEELRTSIGQQTFLVGEHLSAADVIVWTALFPFFNSESKAKGLRDEFGGIARWYDAFAQEKCFQQAQEQIFPSDLSEKLKGCVLSQPSKALATVKTRNIWGRASLEAGTSSPTNDNTEAASEPAASVEEIEAATKVWLTGSDKQPQPRSRNHPILPEKDVKNVLITSALPYVNNVPHLGNIIGCVLSADVYSRFCRLRNYNTLYICGTDEYGTATETKAVEEGLTPKQICDKYNKIHGEIYKWFNIDFDYFGRTTTQQQTQIAQDIFWDLEKNGYVLRNSVDQLQCVSCNRFLADRFVEGTCPLCAYEDARGDQCDKCGKLINAVDLIKPRCKVCGQSPIVKSSDHLFLDLPNLEPQLSKYLDDQFSKGLWSSNTKVITKAWIRDGLKPRCISRDLKWGTPVPLPGYTDKVFYVWYDAPIGYISITANYTDQWEQWWKNPKEVELYNFMAKDNVPFHSVIFPCTLLGTKSDWTMVNHLNATEYLNYEDGKFSKSRGVGVFGNNAQDTGIPADIWRFYLLFLRPESQDSAFNWDDFVLKNNSELLNNLGNFINRALMFINNNFGGMVPTVELSTDEDKELIALVTRELCKYIDNLEKIKLRDGIRNILSISRLGNQYIQANKPWVLVKGNKQEKDRAGSVLGLAANIACLLSVMTQPYMPEVSKTIQTQLNAPSSINVLTDKFVCSLPAGHQIGQPKPLFQKIEASVATELKKRFAGEQKPLENKASADLKNASVAPLDPAAVERLTAQVAKQGEVVRELKSAKAEKSTIDIEVKKLLELKKQLSEAQGLPAADGKKKKGGNNKKAANNTPPPAVVTNNAPDGAAAERLAAEVTKQGDIVRQLKSSKAEKGSIDAAVSKLLDLKKQLALAEGKDPQEAVGGGGKKKKGKKK